MVSLHEHIIFSKSHLTSLETVRRLSARVGLKSGTMTYYVTVETLVLVAADVDLLESSSQSLFCRRVANCVGSLRDVARLGICRKSTSSNRRCKAKTGRYQNTFAGVLCPLQSLCFQNTLTDHVHVPDFSTLFHALKLESGHELQFLCKVVNVKLQAQRNPSAWVAPQDPGIKSRFMGAVWVLLYQCLYIQPFGWRLNRLSRAPSSRLASRGCLCCSLSDFPQFPPFLQDGGSGHFRKASSFFTKSS